MHPHEPSPDAAVFECFGCGSRVTDPATRTCEDCGGELNNISRPREL